MPGDKILREGEKGTEMFFIQEGMVEVLTKKSGMDRNKHRLDRTFLKKGDYFGEVKISLIYIYPFYSGFSLFE